ncbi:MAG: response regulator [Patescibacteria group bacterium]|nr:response regulator [Patescibacteria group bacterium]MDD5715629.1 response regulator [Patescibacteria group bacterium]
MTTPRKVLLVEDDLSLLKIYSNKLRVSGYAVSPATTGDEALRKAQTEKPDIVLLDLILPGKDGFKVLEELKASDITKSVPVIILSNLGQEADIERGNDLGAVDYLVKSDVSLAELVEKVRSYVPQT